MKYAHKPLPAFSGMSRRRLLGSGLAALDALASKNPLHATEAVPQKPEVRLRFSSWLIGLQGDLDQQLDFVEKAGFEAVELRGGVANNRARWARALNGRPLEVSGLDWGHFTDMVSDDAAKRQKSIDSLKYAIEAAHELKAQVLVCVPPRHTAGVKLPDPIATRKILMETLTPLAGMAAEAGTSIGIEAVRRSSVNCLHTLVEVAGFIRESKCEGLSLVADFCIMMEEETNQTGAVLSGGKYIKQVHLSSRKRTLPGEEKEDEAQFLEGFRGLKMIGYNGFCSFECGKANYQDGVLKSMAFLRDVWARA
ncbi:sugar phosphate isomerase/epimerase family protein [Prosthecobacter vanneervenii]|uniref:Sugar phosphate isomerase/epimerase n=1 Tax=Prosthecobacter vanneervenii TaxID=48466 RepID=A0A7W7Y8J1_9BACT|nr:sugar phosphate isomerase/epimerase family protein [Prosthecobacter vanneervenii]MBB5031613.1 sugar phosphate isomerase/epimerase [Prosthecobacter vanneervenii]